MREALFDHKIGDYSIKKVLSSYYYMYILYLFNYIFRVTQ